MTMGLVDTTLLLGSMVQTAGLPPASNSAPHGHRAPFRVCGGPGPLRSAPSVISCGVVRRPTFTLTVSVAGLTAGDISRTSPSVVTDGLGSKGRVGGLLGGGWVRRQ